MQPNDEISENSGDEAGNLPVAPVEVRLLGGLEVRAFGEPVSFPTRHAALLFAYLAATPGTARTRAHLAALIWSERAEEQARGSLRQTIFRVRRAFAGIEPEVIQADAHSIAVNPAAIRSDLDALESEGQAATGEFLAGWDGISSEMDSWIWTERVRVADAVRANLQIRADRAEAAGDVSGQIEAARQLTTLDPYDEGAAQRLMIAFARSGNTVAAEGVFQALTTRLSADLQVEPGPETVALAAEIAEHKGRFASQPAQKAHLPFPAPELVGAEIQEQRLITVVAAWALPEESPQSRAPDQVLEIRRRCEAAFANAVNRHGGTTDRAPGLMCFSYFGWPDPAEDAAALAVKAALEMQQISPCRIGVSSGEMLIEPGRGPVGVPPDIAMALMARASPGQILIAQSTQELTVGRFRLAQIDPADGSAGASVLGLARLPGRFGARDDAASSAMVGRQREFDLVKDRLERANEGEGQLVIVTGEAGIGKTRFHEEVARAALEFEARRVLLQCEQRGLGTPFKPVLDHIAIAAGLSQAPDVAARTHRLNAHLEEAGITNPAHVTAIAQLLNVAAEPGAPEPEAALPADRRAEAIAALLSYFLSAKGDWLTFVVLEDAHWADPSTLELIEHLCGNLGSNRLLLVLTGRSGLDASRFPGRFRTDLSLQGLSRADAAELVKARTGADSRTDQGMIDRIVAQADGVPLFLEELARAHAADGSSENGTHDVPAPSLSLKAVLEARLHDIGPHKPVVQRAACIGRQFDRGALAAACAGDVAEVDQALAAMLQARMIFRYLGAGGEEYFFSHALVAETAHESLGDEDRRDTHRRLYHHFRRDSEAPVETAARHAALAGLHREALGLYKKGGAQALAEFAHREARALFNEALAQLPRLRFTEESEDERLDIMGKLSLCAAHDMGYGHPETAELLGEAQRLAVSRPTSRFTIPILWQTYSLHYTHADGERARDVGEQVLGLRSWNEEYGPQEALGNRFVAAGNLILGNFAEADTAFTVAIRALENPASTSSIGAMGIDQIIPINLLHARVRTILGDEPGARRLISEGLARAEKVGLAQTSITAHVLAAQTTLILEDIAETIRLAEVGRKLSSEGQSSMWASYSNCILGIARMRLSGGEDSIAQFRAGRAALERSKTVASTTILDAMFAAELARRGEKDAARQIFEAISEATTRNVEPWSQAEVIRLDLAANPLTGRHDTATAAALLEKAEDIAGRQGAVLWLNRLGELRLGKQAPGLAV